MGAVSNNMANFLPVFMSPEEVSRPKICQRCRQSMELKQINLTEAVRLCYNCPMTLEDLDCTSVEFIQRSYRYIGKDPKDWVDNLKSEEEELNNLKSLIKKINSCLDKYDDPNENASSGRGAMNSVSSNGAQIDHLNDVEGASYNILDRKESFEWDSNAIEELEAALDKASFNNVTDENFPFPLNDIFLPINANVASESLRLSESEVVPSPSRAKNCQIIESLDQNTNTVQKPSEASHCNESNQITEDTNSNTHYVQGTNNFSEELSSRPLESDTPNTSLLANIIQTARGLDYHNTLVRESFGTVQSSESDHNFSDRSSNAHYPEDATSFYCNSNVIKSNSVSLKVGDSIIEEKKSNNGLDHSKQDVDECISLGQKGIVDVSCDLSYVDDERCSESESENSTSEEECLWNPVMAGQTYSRPKALWRTLHAPSTSIRDKICSSWSSLDPYQLPDHLSNESIEVSLPDLLIQPAMPKIHDVLPWGLKETQESSTLTCLPANQYKIKCDVSVVEFTDIPEVVFSFECDMKSTLSTKHSNEGNSVEETQFANQILITVPATEDITEETLSSIPSHFKGLELSSIGDEILIPLIDSEDDQETANRENYPYCEIYVCSEGSDELQKDQCTLETNPAESVPVEDDSCFISAPNENIVMKDNMESRLRREYKYVRNNLYSAEDLDEFQKDEFCCETNCAENVPVEDNCSSITAYNENVVMNRNMGRRLKSKYEYACDNEDELLAFSGTKFKPDPERKPMIARKKLIDLLDEGKIENLLFIIKKEVTEKELE